MSPLQIATVSNASQITAIQQHSRLFSGTVRYVAPDGDGSNNGTSPNTPFLTIGKAILESSPGDAITVKAGTYTETGLDMNLNALELWCEIGVLIDPVSGTALTISGNSCRVTGEHKVTPAALATGILISGSECVIENPKVIGGAIGIQVTGSGVILNEPAVGFPTSIAYDLQGVQGRIYRGKTVGNAATTGYKISNGADTGVLEQCTSAGHAASGFYIDTGSQDWTVLNCSSGAGDGRLVDTDHANVWSNFTYDDEIVKETTFAGAATTYNLFKVTGAVQISELYGVVETIIPNTASNIHLELYSTGGTVDITDAPGPDIDTLVVGSMLARIGDSTVALDMASAATPSVIESTSYRDPKSEIICVADADQDTYIRVFLSAALASGKIHWHCHYESLSDSGFLESA